MSLGDAIKISRQKALFTQQDFAQKLNVALSTVNRWELNKTKPNMKAMKKLRDFCDEYGADYKIIEKEWLVI
ncbi:MAG: helix-turn-helix transcriptional regulator [Clostridia bacterium]|nr:helix-turn-helix transcriptional regulator [Clostridia bacterium]